MAAMTWGLQAPRGACWETTSSQLLLVLNTLLGSGCMFGFSLGRPLARVLCSVTPVYGNSIQKAFQPNFLLLLGLVYTT